jgi:DNA replication protein DnaC
MRRLMADPDSALREWLAQNHKPLLARVSLRNIRTSSAISGEQAQVTADLAELSGRLAKIQARADDPAELPEHVQRLGQIAIGFRDELARQRHRLRSLDVELDRLAERAAIDQQQPLGCQCLGLGGHGWFTVWQGQPSWERPCLACPLGRAMHEQVAAYWRARALEPAPLEADDREATETAERMQLFGLDPDRRLDLVWAALEVDAGKAAAIAAARDLVDRLDAQFAASWLTWGEIEVDGQVLKTTRRAYPPLDGKLWLYLYGDTGRGKTTIAQAILTEWAARHELPGAWYVNVSTLLQGLKSSFDRRDGAPLEGAQLPSEILKPVRTRRLVVLDDLGTEQQAVSGWARATLYELLNHRYAERLPTIITSNLQPIAAIARFGGDAIEQDRIVSRIAEMAGTPIEVAGRNFRAPNWINAVERAPARIRAFSGPGDYSAP